MTKHVVPTDQVAHLWAHQSQDNARNGSQNVRFDGPTFYSYATPIGHLVEDRNGERVALFTSHSYSNTTRGKHMWPMMRAASHLPHFTVPAFGIYGGRHREPGDARGNFHAYNLIWLCEQYRGEVARMLRKVQPPRDLDAIGARLAEMVRKGPAAYAARFVTSPKARAALRKLDPKADASAIQARFARLEVKRADPAYIAKREREREQREARRTVKEQAEREAREARHAENERRRAEETAQAIAEYPGKVAAWRAGTEARFPWNPESVIGAGAFLRILGDEVQTSQGARVPVADARRAVLFVAECKRNARAWHRNGEKFPVGAFQLDSIAANGDVTAGCHFIEWAEVERLADALALGIGSDGVRCASAQT